MKQNNFSRVLNQLIVLILLLSALAHPTDQPARADQYYPSIFANPEAGMILAQSWPRDIMLEFFIDNDDDLQNGFLVSTTKPAEDDEWSNTSRTYWEDFGTIPEKAFITVRGGGYTKVLEISELKDVFVDTETDRITGTTNHPERDIWIEIGENNGRWIRGDDSRPIPWPWVADFSTPGTNWDDSLVVDLGPGAAGPIHELDNDGDWTVGSWEATGEVVWDTLAVNQQGPNSMAFDSIGNLYIANQDSGANSHISRIMPDGTTTVFPTEFTGLVWLTMRSDDVLVASDDTNQIFTVSPPGTVSVLVNNNAGLSNPNALAVDSTGTLYVVNAGGFVSKFSSTGELLAGDLLPVTSTPQGIALDETNHILYISDANGFIYKIDMDTGLNEVLVQLQIGLWNEGKLVFDSQGTLYYYDLDKNIYRVSSLTGGYVSCLRMIAAPRGLMMDAQGKLTVANYDTGQILRASGCGTTTTEKTFSAISGTVYAVEKSPGNEAAGVLVEICNQDMSYCRIAFTGELGIYEVWSLPLGTYNIRVLPPNMQPPGYLGPIAVAIGEHLSENDIVLPAPPEPPPADAITPARYSEVPRVYWNDILTLTAHGCPGGTARYELYVYGSKTTLSGVLNETSAGSGTYSATLEPLYPYHDFARVTFTFTCPVGQTTGPIEFYIYIDPSGVVMTTSGVPLPGATVTLLRLNFRDNLFYPLRDGSILMSPSNRTNPDNTDADGRFGWDVVTGVYKVRAEKTGCHAPGQPNITFVETIPLYIPPPAMDLELVLECSLANQPPILEQLVAPMEPRLLGSSIVATATFIDLDSNDSHTIQWDWGDGETSTTLATVPSVATAHTYASAGVYTVTATITDAAGGSDTETFQYVVIYDPNGGFVTGGGWINSPVGAYTADPTLTGKATFGFVSKYQKGANVPTGNTEFQFKVADLNFKSTSYDWLVIAGTKAQYKGTGTINGAGEYKFMLTAIDSTPDKFRIKIWDKATGQIVYDNQLGGADTADPTTALGGGSIVIHK